MKKILFGLSSAALAFLVGCATEPAVKKADTGTQVAAVNDIDGNLAKLRSLSVFQVGQMIDRKPIGPVNIYSQPRPETDPAVIAQVHASQAERLARLAETATTAVGAAKDPKACEQPRIDFNLASLRALEIVEVGNLVVETPKASGQCYNLPCPEDIQAAKAVTCERAEDLAAIAAAAKGM